MQTLRTGIILLVIFCLAVSITSAEETIKVVKDRNLIHVSGTGTVKTSPDRCDISFSVITRNSDVKAAQKENSRKMDQIVSVMKNPSKGNLTSLEIGTSSYSVSEVSSPDDALQAKFGKNTIIYEVSNTISVDTSQIDRIGVLIDMAVTNGANKVRSLQFTLSKQKRNEYRSQALAIAVDKAKADADAVTRAMGVNLGMPYEITVDDTYYPVYYNQDVRSANYAGDAPSPSIEPGSIDVSAKVSVTYEIT
jgi:uncharacterized protein YggE